MKTVEPAPLKTSYKLAQLKQVLDELRTKSHAVEANLADVLSPTPNYTTQLQKESKKLLAEVGTHYLYCKARTFCQTKKRIEP